ncbi:response regulator [Oscillochloris sp. ZM17-4]|uniref:ATP-binding protein n=1 Tax=Oscillochloris sp. ZM17-4 TaxID=2866714 RepID=UPI001C733EF9|nr:ATP-binding protein [Oscillochloris sp. ZM17-4]MBX0330565.1 response regulator [Oscillochloris sp. ZM17-4]
MAHSITGKVMIGVGVFLAFLTLIAAQAVYGITITSEALSHLTRTVLPQVTLDGQFELRMLRATADISRVFYDRSPDELAIAQEQVALARQAMDALAQIEDGDADPLFAQLRARRLVLLGRAEALLAEAALLVDDHDATIAASQIDALEQMEVDLDDLIAQHSMQTAQAMSAGAREAEAPVRAARNAAPIGFGVIGLVAILVSWLFHIQIVRPVRALAGVATAIGAGQLDQDIDTSGVDEVGHLQLALRQMVMNLRDRERALMEHTAQIIEHQRVELELTKERDIAEAASQAKSSFLSVISHELRTPLTAIIGYSQLMEHLVAADDYRSVATDLHHIYDAGRHLLTLINDVLDLSRIEAGRLQLSAERVDVPYLIHSVVSTVKPLIEQNGSTLQISCPTHMAMMYTDPLKVRQALLNLLGNAAKFTEAGTIWLSVAQERDGDADWVTFVVADTGIGIAADQMPKLFKPFSQIDDSLNRRYSGTGLGLALSQRLCHLLGGDITVESIFGVGSTFTMRLPAIAPTEPAAQLEPLVSLAAAPAVAEAAPEEPVPIVSENLVLVIDGDPAVGSLIARAIGPEHACVVHAASGAGGVELARDVLPELILLNLLIPDMDAWHVLATLKADPALAPIPVVMISIDNQRQRGLTLGVADFITNPCDQATIAAALRWLPAPTPTSGYILVVEDDSATADLYLRALEGEGWRAVVAESAREALSAITVHHPAAIVIDLLMPDMDGVQMISTLRTRPGSIACPIIIMAASDLSGAERAQLKRSARQILTNGAHTLDDLPRQMHSYFAAHIGASLKHTTEIPND